MFPFPSPGDLPDPGMESGSPILQADSLPSEPPRKPRSHPWVVPNGGAHGLSWSRYSLGKQFASTWKPALTLSMFLQLLEDSHCPWSSTGSLCPPFFAHRVIRFRKLETGAHDLSGGKIHLGALWRSSGVRGSERQAVLGGDLGGRGQSGYLGSSVV